MSDFQPRGSLLRVRMLEAPERTEGGLWLPETCRENFSEAEVLRVGPGRRDAEGECWSPYVIAGQTVCFQKHEWRDIGQQQEGLVDSEALLGVTVGDTLRPLGDWLLVKPEPRPRESKGGVGLPDVHQRWRQRGQVLAVGPGRLEVNSSGLLTRRTPRAIMGLSESAPLVGRAIVWEREAKILQVGRATVCGWLVAAESVVAFWEPDAAGG